jgi:hypothetical protein
VFIVVETLLSNSFAVSGERKDGGSIELDVPALQDLVDVELGLKAEVSSKAVVEYSGPMSIPFAFVAARLKYLDGRWRVDGFPEPGSKHLSDVEVIDDFSEQGLHGGVVFGDGDLLEVYSPH